MANQCSFYIGTHAKGLFRATLGGDTGEIAALCCEAEIIKPAYLILNRAQDRLYAVGEAPAERGGIFSFARDRETGALTLLGSCMTGEGPLCHLCLDESEQNLYAASYREGTVFRFSLDAAGAADAIRQRFFHPGGSRTVEDRQDSAHAHCCAFSPSGDLLVADLGTDEIVVYRHDPATGDIARDEARVIAVRAGEGPRHLVMHPTLPVVYLLCELGCSLMVYAAGEPGGPYRLLQTLPTLPEGFTGKGECAAIRMAQDGRFVYATNRGANDIAAFAVNPADGTLALAAHFDSAGAFPRDINFAMEDRCLLAANQNSNGVASFWRDAATGGLRCTGHSIEVEAPVCIVAAR